MVLFPDILTNEILKNWKLSTLNLVAERCSKIWLLKLWWLFKWIFFFLMNFFFFCIFLAAKQIIYGFHLFSFPKFQSFLKVIYLCVKDLTNCWAKQVFFFQWYFRLSISLTYPFFKKNIIFFWSIEYG